MNCKLALTDLEKKKTISEQEKKIADEKRSTLITFFRMAISAITGATSLPYPLHIWPVYRFIRLLKDALCFYNPFQYTASYIL